LEKNPEIIGKYWKSSRAPVPDGAGRHLISTFLGKNWNEGRVGRALERLHLYDNGLSRKAGEMLGRLERGEAHRPKKLPNDGKLSEFNQVLKDTETSTQDASRWQKIAEIPEERFEVRGLYFEAWSLVRLQDKTMEKGHRENGLGASWNIMSPAA